MLEHKFYHRARKVPVSELELKGKKKEKKPAEPGDEEKKDKDKGTDAESSVIEGAKETQVLFFRNGGKSIMMTLNCFQEIIFIYW